MRPADFSEDQVAVRRHRLAFKLEGVPHLSTTLPKVQWKGIADLVYKFWAHPEVSLGKISKHKSRLDLIELCRDRIRQTKCRQVIL